MKTYPTFVNIDAMLARIDAFDVAQVERCKKGPWGDTSARDSEPRPFNGNKTYDQARAMADTGWKAGLPKLKDALKLARAPYEHSVTYEMPADVHGPAVDPAAYFAGVPEAFHTPVEVDTVQLGYDGVEVVFNAFVSSSVETSVIYSRGATCILLAHVCAMSSIPCRIVLGFSTSDKAQIESADFSAVLSDWDDTLDFPKLAYWLCHASATRRLGFRLMDSHDIGMDLVMYSTPRNTTYKSGDRFKRIVVNHGLQREQLSNPQSAVDEIVAVMLKEGKVVNV